MSEVRAFWEEVEAIFDPEVAVVDPGLFVEREPAYNPLSHIERALRRPTRVNRKYLLTGTVGNGKTSELYHFADQLGSDRMIVLIDLWRHFQDGVGDPAAMSRLEPWELLGLLGLAIYRAGDEHFGHRWGDEPKALEKALEDLRKADQDDGPKIDLVSLAKTMAIGVSGAAGALAGGPVGALVAAKIGQAATDTGLAMLESAGKSVQWSWRIGLPKNKRREDQDVRQVLDAVNRMILALNQAYGRRLLLLVDGLDRASASRIKVLFVESALLGDLVCDAVWTAPRSVRRLHGHETRGFEAQELCNVPVLLRRDPSQFGPGLGFYRSLVAKRIERVNETLGRPGPQQPFPERLLDRLAYYSGGLSRDFVRMVRFVASEAWEAQVDAIDDAIVDLALRETRRLKEAQINAKEIELLEGVMIDPARRLPEGDMAAALVDQQRLLAYPNETTWYYPHPLLTLALLGPRPGSPS
jgi:hypothetical protein